MGYDPEFKQWNWLAMVKAKEMEAIEQAQTLTEPATASAKPAQPKEESAAQSQKLPKYCVICPPQENFAQLNSPYP